MRLKKHTQYASIMSLSLPLFPGVSALTAPSFYECSLTQDVLRRGKNRFESEGRPTRHIDT
jgi:hypothetical protein